MTEVRSIDTVWRVGNAADASSVGCVRVVSSRELREELASERGAEAQQAEYMRVLGASTEETTLRDEKSRRRKTSGGVGQVANDERCASS